MRFSLRGTFSTPLLLVQNQSHHIERCTQYLWLIGFSGGALQDLQVPHGSPPHLRLCWHTNWQLLKRRSCNLKPISSLSLWFLISLTYSSTFLNLTSGLILKSKASSELSHTSCSSLTSETRLPERYPGEWQCVLSQLLALPPALSQWTTGRREHSHLSMFPSYLNCKTVNLKI